MLYVISQNKSSELQQYSVSVTSSITYKWSQLGQLILNCYSAA